jgi:hypothetical protein
MGMLDHNVLRLDINSLQSQWLTSFPCHRLYRGVTGGSEQNANYRATALFGARHTPFPAPQCGVDFAPLNPLTNLLSAGDIGNRRSPKRYINLRNGPPGL